MSTPEEQNQQLIGLVKELIKLVETMRKFQEAQHELVQDRIDKLIKVVK